MKNYRLSVSTGLNQFKNCPKCFWLHYNKNIKRPAGIFPSLPSGMDNVIKQFFDKHRKTNTLPAIIKKKIKGKLVEKDKIDKWRDWRSGLKCNIDGSTLIGALDECLIYEKQYIPLDYKTKGSRPNNGDGERYYQLQLDIYSLLLAKNGYLVADYGYLLYYSPNNVKDNIVNFNIDIIKVNTDVVRAKTVFKEALKVLNNNKPPKSNEDCIYCHYRSIGA